MNLIYGIFDEGVAVFCGTAEADDLSTELMER